MKFVGRIKEASRKRIVEQQYRIAYIYGRDDSGYYSLLLLFLITGIQFERAVSTLPFRIIPTPRWLAARAANLLGCVRKNHNMSGEVS